METKVSEWVSTLSIYQESHKFGVNWYEDLHVFLAQNSVFFCYTGGPSAVGESVRQDCGQAELLDFWLQLDAYIHQYWYAVSTWLC